ncbi:MAG: type II secretion system protein [Phycisphaerales bacterium]|nr:type II secretion system protein [Phycisphaerales bacterium]
MTRRITPRPAFTLVEMLIAIGVVILLAAITVSASIALIQKSEVRQTDSTITVLDLAMSEWEAQSDRKLTWTDGTLAADLADGTPHVYTLTEVLRTIRRSGAVAPILAQIKPEFVYTYGVDEPDPPPWIALGTPGDPDPNAAAAGGAIGNFTNELAVLDAWGTPIRAVHPGRLANVGSGETAQADGTILIDTSAWYGVETIYGPAENRRIRFVSAGPDGQFGDLRAEDGTPEHEAAHDNVVSYPVEDEHE